jgi:hypothetical protein
VSYLPNVDDHDHRLLADSGEGWRTLCARRISSARYVSAVASTFATPAPQQATAAITRVDVRGASATVHWRGNLAADAFDLAVARAAGAWRTVLSARRFTGARRERVSVRVRPHDVAGAWSPARAAVWRGRSLSTCR